MSVREFKSWLCQLASRLSSFNVTSSTGLHYSDCQPKIPSKIQENPTYSTWPVADNVYMLNELKAGKPNLLTRHVVISVPDNATSSQQIPLESIGTGLHVCAHTVHFIQLSMAD